MDQFILPPSPNWQLSNVLACNDNGVLAYGSRSELSIIYLKDNGKFDVSIINFVHKDKINVVVFSPVNGNFKNCLATCGDDGKVRVWDFQEGRLLYCHSGHKDGLKVLGLDWSPVDTNRLVSVNDLGSIVCWCLASNTIRRLHCGIKLLPLTLACCPHDKDLVAIGCKSGITIVVDIKGTGKLVHRLRGHEQDVISISWCPVPYNVIKHKKDGDAKAAEATPDGAVVESKQRDLLLATGGVDKSIFIWRAGSDGRYEVILNLPNNNMNSNFPRKKGYMGASSTMWWTCVHWVDAYTLLSTSQFGELLVWDINKVTVRDKSNTKKPQPRLLHSRHHKGCFTIACPVVHDVVGSLESDTRTVWTTAMDKHIVACSLASGNVTLDIPTLGGIIYTLAISPLDPNRLAIGSSESKVFVWNMSDLASLNIVSYWKKIIGKVMALCWHPREENWLAYGTSDGHVGLIDVGSNKIPTLFRLHHRRPVYRICWTLPLLKSDDDKVVDETKLVLYSVGDGDVIQYTADPQEPNEEPKSLNNAVLNSFDKSLGLQNSLIRSDIAFKPDFTCFAVGNENGSVYIVTCDTLKLKHTVYPHKKLMNNLEWHPETVASDNSISPYKDWLATTCDNIKVYNIPAEEQPELVATFSGHSEKIVGLAWSPHFNGRLLSASYDDSVQVWDVPSQTCLGIYRGHGMAVMCALFSPQNPDMIISGSSDNTVRHWSLSQLPQVSVVKPGKKKERMGAIDRQRSGAEEATELVVGMSELTRKEESSSAKQNSATNTSPISHNSVSDKSVEDYKKRLKNRTVFGVTGPKLTQARHFNVLYQRWVAANHLSTPSPTQPPSDEQVPSATELGYLDFFGDDKAMRRLLMVEESQLADNKQHMLAQTSALWRGDVSQMMQDAITKKKLSEWLVSMAPLAGFDVWEAACATYAEQLAECGDALKAASYLLAIHKTHEAVQLLAERMHFKEAVAVARCRLGADDPLIAEVYMQWGNTVRLQGSLTLAAHCYLAAKNTQLCLETLARVKELQSLKMAAKMARQLGHFVMADSLAGECLTMCVTASNLAVGHQLVEEMPQYKFWSVWLRASELLAKVKNRGEVEVFDWLEGRGTAQFSLIDDLYTFIKSLAIENTYEKLTKHLPTNRNPEHERELWCYVSGHLAGACAARLETTTSLNFLRHTVSALSAAFHYQMHHPSSLALLLTVSVLAPKGLFGEKNMFSAEYKTDEEKQLVKSLRAFVCASIVNWISNNWEKVTGLRAKREKSTEKGDGDSSQEVDMYKMSWLPELIASCSSDVLDAENVSFFVKKALKEELQNVVTKETIKNRMISMKNVDDNANKRKQNKLNNKTGKVQEQAEDETIDKLCVESQSSKKEIANKMDENLNGTQNKSDSKNVDNLVVGQHTQNTTDQEHNLKSLQKDKENSSSDDLKTKVSIEKSKEEKVIETNVPKIVSCPDENPEEVLKNLQKNKENADKKSSEQSSSTAAIQILESSTTKSSSINGDTATTNGASSNDESKEDIDSKLKEIKEIDTILQKFEATRVSVPSPFTAYLNIKYVIDNIVSKQDLKSAQNLQENCDKIWNKSHN